MRHALRIIDGLIGICVVVGGLAVVAMMLHIVADVALKLLANAPLPGVSVYVSNYYMVAVGFLPLAMAERANQHISVEVLTQAFSRRWQLYAQFLGWLFAFGICALMVYRLWIEADKKTSVGAFVVDQTERMVTWPSYWFLPLGFGLLALTLVVKMALFFVDRRHAEADLDGSGAAEQTDPEREVA